MMLSPAPNVPPLSTCSGPNCCATIDAMLLAAVAGGRVQGYLLGFVHMTPFANGPVAWSRRPWCGSGYRRKGVGHGRRCSRRSSTGRVPARPVMSPWPRGGRARVHHALGRRGVGHLLPQGPARARPFQPAATDGILWVVTPTPSPARPSYSSARTCNEAGRSSSAAPRMPCGRSPERRRHAGW